MRKLKLGEVISLGQSQAAGKWQSWNSTKFPLYPQPCALNHSLFSESVLLPLNCCLFKLCVWKKSASQYLNNWRWRIYYFCFSAFVLATINEEKPVFTKANNSTFAFQWAHWELTHGLINLHAHTIFKRCRMLQNNTSPEAGCWQWARG